MGLDKRTVTIKSNSATAPLILFAMNDTPPVEGLKARPMTAADREIRASALFRNLNRVAPTVTWEEIDGPRWASYVGFDVARGDTGLVLEAAGPGEQPLPVGSIWAGFHKGLGYVSDEVPEIVLNVAPEWQGRGLGGWLLEEVANHGRENGWHGLSLSAENGHPARRLYGRHDFVAQDQNGTMLRKLSPIVRSVAVYCGSAVGERHEFAEAARALGTALAQQGIALVYGGGDVGLMGIVADACLAAGGEVVGVMPRDLVDLEIAHSGLTQLEVTGSMSERKKRMEDLADAYVALPGGMGTLEELFQVLVRQQLGPYTGPVALMNVEGYWSPMLKALRSMSEEGFVPERYLDALVVASTPQELFDGFASWSYPGLKWKR